MLRKDLPLRTNLTDTVGGSSESTITIYANPIVSKIRTNLLSESGGITIPEPLTEVPWNPSYITTDLWVTTSELDSVVLVSGAASQWLDLSGKNQHFTQSVVSKRPLSSQPLNSLNGLTFDGSDDVMDLATGFMNSWSQFSMFFVMKGPTNANNVFFAPKNKFSVGVEYITSTASSLFTTLRTNGTTRFTDNLYSRDSNAAITSVMAGSSVIGRKNGSNVTASNSSAIASLNYNGVYCLGQYAANVAQIFGQFTVYELIIINGFLSIADSEVIEGYLAHKWALASLLPSGHPYKTVTPTAFA